MFGRIGQGFGRLGGSRHMSSEVKKVTLIPGDGIGPEIAKSVQKYVETPIPHTELFSVTVLSLQDLRRGQRAHRVGAG